MSDIKTITVQAGGTVNIYFGCNFMGSGSPKRTRKEKAPPPSEPEDQIIEEVEEDEEEVSYRKSEEVSDLVEEAKAYILACEQELSVNCREIFGLLSQGHVAEILAAGSPGELDEVLGRLFPDAG